MTWAASDEALNWQEVMLGVLTWLPWAQLIVGVHRMFYCDSSDYSSNDNGDQYMAARQRAALEEVFNQYKARFFHPSLVSSVPVVKTCSVHALHQALVFHVQVK